MTAFTSTLSLSGQSALAASVPVRVTSHPTSERLSGIVVNQNQPPAEDTDFLPVTDEWIFQTFYLPDNYTRDTDNPVTPPLTGLQVFVTVADGYAHTATLDYRLDYYVVGTGWIQAIEGTAVGAHTDSADATADEGLWFDLYFEPQAIDALTRNHWRLGIKGRDILGEAKDELVEYDGTSVLIGSHSQKVVPTISPTPLREGETYPFEYFGIPSILYVEPGSGNVYYSVQQGVTGVWYSLPDPLESSNDRAYTGGGVIPIKDGGADISLLFRVLAGTADDGRDFLGNTFRGSVHKASVANASTVVADKYWLSKPNPSRFAVESLYFDVRNLNESVVIDRIYLDPITPGVFFNVYYSNDPLPGTDERTWEYLLWERIPRSYSMQKADTYALPHPITAKYIKLEFTHLQAKPYTPGDFEKPMLYKKHPRWVADFFFAVYENRLQENQRKQPRSVLNYDALDLAYGYYLDDIRQDVDAPDVPPDATSLTALNTFLDNTPVTANIGDVQTVTQIRTVFRPFLDSPFFQGRFGTLLRDYGDPDPPARLTNYPTEIIRRSAADTSFVSVEDRADLIIEKQYPVMYFYLTARHGYQLSSAHFASHVAYFAGVKEVAFLRDHYAPTSDSAIYIESMGDTVNIEQSDLTPTFNPTANSVTLTTNV